WLLRRGAAKARPHMSTEALFRKGFAMTVAAEMESPRERRRERGGRSARREQRSHPVEGLHRPYIVRGIPTYDIMSEENLVRIEETADRILAEIGIEFRD